MDLTLRRTTRLFGAWLALELICTAPARAQEVPRFDGRDRYTLFDRHLQTRELGRQLAQPDQKFRLARDWSPLQAAGDAQIGTQQVYGHGVQTHFHGFAIADTFLSLRILPELSVTLNVLAFNPSASDAYRVSATIKPGIALDAGADLFRVAGKPLHLHVTATDLGVQTLGNGLLLEQTELEGVAGALEYGDARFSYLYGGRALWSDDDLIRSELSLFSRRLRLMFVEWQLKYALRDTRQPVTLANISVERHTARFADLAVDLPLPGGFRSALEYALRLSQAPASGALLRVDWLRRNFGRFDLHAGYQFRFYQHGLGPRNLAVPPSVPFSFPYQEDAYVTNPFEYLGLGDGFDQWSHTFMLEARFELVRGLEIFGNNELWQRTASAFSRPAQPVATRAGFVAPGRRFDTYYSAGLSYYPWHGLPHRADVFVTNKQVPGYSNAEPERFRETTYQRFSPGRYYVLRFKALF